MPEQSLKLYDLAIRGIFHVLLAQDQILGAFLLHVLIGLRQLLVDKSLYFVTCVVVS